MHRVRILALAIPLVATTPAIALAGGEVAKYVPSGGGVQEQFGHAVAISGSTAVIGATFDGDTPAATGSVYVFNTTSGQEVRTLLANDRAFADLFGYSVAIEGDLVVVGARWDDDNGEQSGSAYLFDAATGQQLAKLLPTDGAAGDYFGASVGLFGTVVVVGAPKDDDNGAESGSAYLFDAVTGQQTAKLLASDGAAGNGFGGSVAVHTGLVAIGAAGGGGNGVSSGSAYLFVAGTGQEIAKLLPDDGVSGDQFGASVDIGGSALICGAPFDSTNFGSAYVFDRVTGLQLEKLIPNDGGASQLFGTSVAINGELAAAGALRLDGASPGTAYLFDTTTGLQIAQLLASDGVQPDHFGRSIALDGGLALVGTPLDSVNGTGSGSAYLFDTGQSIAAPYCFGTGAGTPCPCANSGVHGYGCANSEFGSGTRLFAIESPCVASGDFTLYIRYSPIGQPGVFFQGDNTVNGGLGVQFGDGLRCAGGGVIRLEVTMAGGSGAATSSIPIAIEGGVSAGDVKRYQWWYRDPGGSPCGSGFNFSNGLEVVWGP